MLQCCCLLYKLICLSDFICIISHDGLRPNSDGDTSNNGPLSTRHFPFQHKNLMEKRSELTPFRSISLAVNILSMEKLYWWFHPEKFCLFFFVRQAIELSPLLNFLPYCCWRLVEDKSIVKYKLHNNRKVQRPTNILSLFTSQQINLHHNF